MNDALLIELGIIRVCECRRRFTDRTEFRKHQRETFHTQNMSGRIEAQHLTAEEKAARQKGGKFKNVSTK